MQTAKTRIRAPRSAARSLGQALRARRMANDFSDLVTELYRLHADVSERHAGQMPSGKRKSRKSNSPDHGSQGDSAYTEAPGIKQSK
jgi:hypothetical protein